MHRRQLAVQALEAAETVLRKGAKNAVAMTDRGQAAGALCAASRTAAAKLNQALHYMSGRDSVTVEALIEYVCGTLAAAAILKDHRDYESEYELLLLTADDVVRDIEQLRTIRKAS